MNVGLMLQNAKVAWVTPSLGTADSILYMKPLLESFSSFCSEFRIFIPNNNLIQQSNLGFKIESSGQTKRFFRQEVDGYRSEIRLITPAIIVNILRYKPDLIIINDFSLQAFFTTMIRILRPNLRILLLVEAKPPFIIQNQIIQGARKILRTLVIKLVDQILTNNIDGGNYLISQLLAPPDRVIVKPYLVSDMKYFSNISDKDLLDNRISRNTSCQLRFLYVGRLIAQKGLQYALISLAKLLPKYAGRFYFDVVGGGPFLETLMHQAKNLGLGQYVKFHGKQPYSSLWKWYLKANVFLFPTLSDYRALAPFEALSMGLPIIGSIYDGGVKETVEYGRNGFFFDPRDTARLAHILKKFMESPEIIRDLSIRSLEMASAYTLEMGLESLFFACKRTLNVC